MSTEKKNNYQIVSPLHPSVDSDVTQRVPEYAKYLKATSKSKAKQSDVDQLADEANVAWWTKNCKRFII